MISMKKSDYDLILEHAKSVVPEEACGLIAGTIDNGSKTVGKVYILTNIDHSNEHFTLDPKEQLAAVKDMRASGLVPLGNWHSHPESPSRPSEEDKRLAYAAGCRHRSLGIDSESVFQGKGVSYCAVCDGAFYRDKNVAVVGGGDTALDDALYLSDICRKVYLIHRRDGFRGSASTLARLKEKADVEIITNARIEQITGDKKVSGADLSNGAHVDIDGIFVAVGMIPQTSLLEGFDVLDDSGYVVAGEDGVTSCSGLFAAGDARTKNLRQVITAASDGANAMYSVMHMLSK